MRANKAFLIFAYTVIEVVIAFSALVWEQFVPESGWKVFAISSIIAAITLYSLYWIDTRGEFGRSNDAKVVSWPPRNQNHSPRFGNRPHESFARKAKRLVVERISRKAKG